MSTIILSIPDFPPLISCLPRHPSLLPQGIPAIHQEQASANIFSPSSPCQPPKSSPPPLPVIDQAPPARHCQPINPVISRPSYSVAQVASSASFGFVLLGFVLFGRERGTFTSQNPFIPLKQ
jgi:hypothetical protein